MRTIPIGYLNNIKPSVITDSTRPILEIRENKYCILISVQILRYLVENLSANSLTLNTLTKLLTFADGRKQPRRTRTEHRHRK